MFEAALEVVRKAVGRVAVEGKIVAEDKAAVEGKVAEGTAEDKAVGDKAVGKAPVEGMVVQMGGVGIAERGHNPCWGDKASVD